MHVLEQQGCLALLYDLFADAACRAWLRRADCAWRIPTGVIATHGRARAAVGRASPGWWRCAICLALSSEAPAAVRCTAARFTAQPDLFLGVLPIEEHVAEQLFVAEAGA